MQRRYGGEVENIKKHAEKERKIVVNACNCNFNHDCTYFNKENGPSMVFQESS